MDKRSLRAQPVTAHTHCSSGALRGAELAKALEHDLHPPQGPPACKNPSVNPQEPLRSHSLTQVMTCTKGGSRKLFQFEVRSRSTQHT